jgi:SAM-dependent methyltransferase
MDERAVTPRACPLCGSRVTFAFVERPSVAVHQHLLLDDPGVARSLARGALEMRLCEQCGFAFNSRFDPALLAYGEAYDNTQHCSSAFDQYLDKQVQELVEKEGVRDRHIVEVGCGNGRFLRKLVEYAGANNTGLGFDSSYKGVEDALDGRLQFRRSYYGGSSDREADVIVCRHVIEHVADPSTVLRPIRNGLRRSGGPVFLETPSLEWILRHRVIWDFFYEHCSLFTVGSLTTAAQLAGFRGVCVRPVFALQYLWLSAIPGDGPRDETQAGEISELAHAYRREERRRISAWREQVEHHSRRGPVAVWGAGAKGVTFCNLIDPDRRLVAFLIDLNPAKQGCYVAGTGHAIRSAETLRGEDVAAVVVLNPNYMAEIADHVARLGSRAVVIDAMSADRRCACA